MKRFSKFGAAVFCISIATVALGTEPAPLEYKTAIDLQNNHLFNQNAVTSFVYNTFYMFDKHAPVEQFLNNLVCRLSR